MQRKARRLQPPGFIEMSTARDALGYDAITTYLPIDGLGINALPDSEKYKRGIKENRIGRTRTLGIWMSCQCRWWEVLQDM